MKLKTAILTLVAAAGFATSCPAQSWMDLLGGLFGGGSSSQQTAQPARTYPASVVGTWKYAAPEVEFTGDDIVAKIGGTVAASTIREQMSAYFTKAGITPQSCTVQLRRGGKFTAKISERQIEGRYSYDGSSGTISVTITGNKIGTQTLIGRVSGTESKMTVTFEVAKMAALVKQYPSMTKDDRLSSLLNLAEQYKGLYAGAQFTK